MLVIKPFGLKLTLWFNSYPSELQAIGYDPNLPYFLKHDLLNSFTNTIYMSLQLVRTRVTVRRAWAASTAPLTVSVLPPATVAVVTTAQTTRPCPHPLQPVRSPINKALNNTSATLQLFCVFHIFIFYFLAKRK